MKGAASFLLRAGVTAGILVLLLASIDFGAVLHALRSARLVPFVGAVGFFLIACAVSSAAWMLVLRTLRCRIGFVHAFRLNLVGFFFNNFVPAGVGGDVWRTWVYAEDLSTETGTESGGKTSSVRPIGLVAASVLAERWAAFGAVILLAWAVLPLCFTRFAAVRLELGGGRSLPAPSAVLLLTAVLTIAMVAAMLAFTPLVGLFRARFLRRWGSSGQVERFLAALLAVRREPVRFAAITLVSVASPFVEALAYWLLARALGLSVDPLACIVLTPVLRLTHHFPLTFNGVGVQDAALVWIMAALGVDSAEGLAFSLLVHALKIAVSLLALPLLACNRRRGGGAT